MHIEAHSGGCSRVWDQRAAVCFRGTSDETLSHETSLEGGLALLPHGPLSKYAGEEEQ